MKIPDLRQIGYWYFHLIILDIFRVQLEVNFWFCHLSISKFKFPILCLSWKQRRQQQQQKPYPAIAILHKLIKCSDRPKYDIA